MADTDAGSAPRSRNQEDARLGYETVVGLVRLVSEEIYSRSGAMLIVHALFFTVLFDKDTPDFVVTWVAWVGLALCAVWFLQVFHGLFYQDLFRRLAAKLEEDWFCNTFTVFHSKSEPGVDLTKFAPKSARGLKCLASCVPIGVTITFVIIAFAATYVMRLFLK